MYDYPTSLLPIVPPTYRLLTAYLLPTYRLVLPPSLTPNSPPSPPPPR